MLERVVVGHRGTHDVDDSLAIDNIIDNIIDNTHDEADDEADHKADDEHRVDSETR